MDFLLDKCYSRILLQKRYLNRYWVYAVYNLKRELLFMSYASLKEITSMSPFKLNEKFNEEESYIFVLIQSYDSKPAAENGVTYWINHSELQGTTPPLNIYNKTYNNTHFIQCIENGKFYKTAADVVRIFNISQSALSNHLRGLPGHRSIKGLHFKYHIGENPDEIEIYGGYKLQKAFGGYKTVQSDDPINKMGITEQERCEQIISLVNEYGVTPW